MPAHRRLPSCCHFECIDRKECKFNRPEPVEDKKKPCKCTECLKRHNCAFKKKIVCPIENCFNCSEYHELAKEYPEEFCVCSKCASRHNRAVNNHTKCHVPNCVWCAEYQKYLKGLKNKEAKVKCTGHEKGHCKRTCMYYQCCKKYCGSADCKRHYYCDEGIRVCANSAPYQ